MNSLANEMTARAVIADRLLRAEARRAVALAGTTSTRRPERWSVLRVTLGRRLESLGRRLAGSSEPAPALDRGC